MCDEISKYMLAALCFWISCLILFVVYLCVDAPEWREDHNDDNDGGPCT